MTKFYFIRHGEPDWSLADEKGLKGDTRNFIALTKKGIEQAYQAAEDPRLRQVDILLSSPYTRALQTAAILSRQCNLPLVVEHDLHEWMPDCQFQYEDGQDVRQLFADFIACGGQYPPGETRVWETQKNLRNRVESVLLRFLDYEQVAVVCHSMVIQSFLPLTTVPHCQLFEYEIDSQTRNLERSI